MGGRPDDVLHKRYGYGLFTGGSASTTAQSGWARRSCPPRGNVPLQLELMADLRSRRAALHAVVRACCSRSAPRPRGCSTGSTSARRVRAEPWSEAGGRSSSRLAHGRLRHVRPLEIMAPVWPRSGREERAPFTSSTTLPAGGRRSETGRATDGRGELVLTTRRRRRSRAPLSDRRRDELRRRALLVRTHAPADLAFLRARRRHSDRPRRERVPERDRGGRARGPAFAPSTRIVVDRRETLRSSRCTGARRRGRPGPCARRARAAARDRLRVRVGVSVARPGSIPRQRPGRRAASGSGRTTPIRSVLTSPPRGVAGLATVDRDGRPHVVPICFVLDGSKRLHTTAVDEKPKRTRRLKLAGEHRGEPARRGADRPLRGRLVEALVGAAARDGPDRRGSSAVDLLVAKYPQYAERRPRGR